MSDETREWVSELRRAHEYLDEGKPFFSGRDCAAMADLIEQQAARIAELEARIDANGAEPVVWLGPAPSNYYTRDSQIAKRMVCPQPVYAAPVVDGAMAKDAERYRWLRDKANNMGHVKRAPMVLMTRDDCSNNGWEDALIGEALDAAVDAVIKKE